MLIAKIDMVNKKEYEESEIYKEIKIIIPRSREELEKDFEYLGLNYNNYTIQDTHIKECIFMDKEDEDFAVDISSYVNDMICKANRSGYTTPFQDIKKFYNIVKNFKEYDKYKILAIMEAEEDNIRNIKDVLKYAQNIECFDLTEGVLEKRFRVLRIEDRPGFQLYEARQPLQSYSTADPTPGHALREPLGGGRQLPFGICRAVRWHGRRQYTRRAVIGKPRKGLQHMHSQLQTFHRQLTA